LDTVRRRKKLFDFNFDQALRGIEVGPLDRPLVKKSECSVLYVDHLNTEGLREKYQHDAGVIQSEIEDVDLVWDGSYKKILETPGLDFVVASHVIEHVPDLVYFLEDLSEVLKQGGLLYLVIPDKRFTFDFLRQTTSISEVLAANLIKQQKPSLSQILDELVFASDHSITTGWADIPTGYAPKTSRSIAEAFQIAKNVQNRDSYFDVHCWIFTPQSFVNLIEQLIELKIINYRIQKIIETEYNEFEFYCVLQKL